MDGCALPFFKMKHKLINFVLFQSIWFIFILSAAHDSLHGALLGFCLLILQYLHGKKLFADCVLIGLAIVIGFIHDGLLKHFNFIIYHIVFIKFYAPIWIIGLWISFALTINHSLAWLQNKPALQIFFGLIGGPLAYLAGEKLGAITLGHEYTVYILALCWALVTPVLFKFYAKGK